MHVIDSDSLNTWDAVAVQGSIGQLSLGCRMKGMGSWSGGERGGVRCGFRGMREIRGRGRCGMRTFSCLGGQIMMSHRQLSPGRRNLH